MHKEIFQNVYNKLNILKDTNEKYKWTIHKGAKPSSWQTWKHAQSLRISGKYELI